jgi:hypothetical protein
MTGRTITLSLTTQQIELIDRTVARGEATDRGALTRRALKEFAAKYPPQVRATGDTDGRA